MNIDLIDGRVNCKVVKYTKGERSLSDLNFEKALVRLEEVVNKLRMKNCPWMNH